MPDPKTFSLELTPEAVEDLRRIDKKNAQRIVKKLRWLVGKVENVRHEALTGQWSGYYRCESVIIGLSTRLTTMVVF